MKGYRFFADMPDARKSKSANKSFPFFPWTVAALRTRAEESGYRADVLALCLDDQGGMFWNNDSTVECVAVTIAGNPHSYGNASASRDYIRQRCTRIPESLARLLSPELFNNYLDKEFT